MSNEYFLGKGAGDLYIKSLCGLLTKTYEVQDCHRYDKCDIDNTSNYTLNRLRDGSTSSSTLVFSTDHYVLSGTGEHDSGITFGEVDGLDNVEVSFDFKLNNQSSNYAWNQCIVCCANAFSSIFSGGKSYGYRVRGDNHFQRFWGGESTQYDVSDHYNAWYKLVFKKQGNTMYCDLYNASGTLLKSDSYTNTTDWTNCYYSILCCTNKGTSYSVHLKNIKIKQL